MNDYTQTGNPTTDAINQARATNIANGQSPYSGTGATSFSTSQGLGKITLPPSINSSSMGNATSIDLPSIPPSTTASGITGSSPAIVAQNALSTSLAQDKADKQAALNSQKGTVQSVMDKITGVQTQQANAEGDATTPGTPAFLKAQAQNASNALDTSEKGRLAELDALQGQGLGQVQLQQRTAEINSRYGRQQADLQFAFHIANSDYTSAEDTLTKKFQLELEPLKTQLQYQQSLYGDLKGDLSKSEDRLWTQAIDESNKALETETANKKGIADIFTTLQTNNPQALKNNPQLGVQIANAKDAVEATQILAKNGISLANPLDTAYKQAQIASLNATAASKTASGAAGGGVTPELQNAINNGTIDPNKINSRTLGIYNDIAKAGVDAVGSHAGAAGETKAITDLSTMRATASKTLNVIDLNLPLVANLADKVNTIGVPKLDAMVSGTQAVLTNNPDVVKYVNSLKTLRSEYAQMLAKGGTATEGDKAEAAQAVPTGLSGDAYRALGDQLKLEANNVISSIDQSITQAKSKSASNTGGVNLTSQFDNLFTQYGGK